MPNRLAVLATVFGDPVLRRLEAAYFIFGFGEWATWVAVIVYAYGRGGAAEAGIVVFLQLAPSIVLAPAVAALGDRFPRDRVLLWTYASQAAVMAVTAAALATSSHPFLIYALACLTATLVALSRPLHAALMPEATAAPDGLTAANVVSGMAESAGSLIGPLGAGLLVGAGGPAAVFAVAAAGNLLGSIALLGVARDGAAARARQAALPTALPLPDRAAMSGRDHWRGRAAELVGGLTAIAADGRLRSVVLIATWATLLVGMMDILYAVLAIELMGLGEDGIGFVGALGGVGAIVGSVAGMFLVGRERLGVALTASALLYGGGIAAIAIAPGPLAQGAILVVAGLGSGLTYVAAQTLIHRLAGDDVMSRVFGVLQGLMMGATAIGAVAVPFVIGIAGERAAFAVAGLSLPIMLVLVGREIVRGDRLDAGRALQLRLLRGSPMLGPLSGPVLERLASGLERSHHATGSTVIRAGELGDRFYIVESGAFDVAVAGRSVRRLGPGDGFGEIALLRDVPRTATVTTAVEGDLLEITRGPFLEALGGQARSRSIAAVLVDDRLAADMTRP